MIIFGILFVLFGIGMLVVIARQSVRPSRAQKRRVAGAGVMVTDTSSGGLDPFYHQTGPSFSSSHVAAPIETSSWDSGPSFSGSSFDSGSSGFDSGGGSGFDAGSGAGASSGGDGCG